MTKYRGLITGITCLIFIIFIIFILPAESQKSATLGLEQSPDTSFFYTKSELLSIAESYGEEGRTFYVRQRLTFDVIWPIAYGAFLTAAIYEGTRALNQSKWKKLYILPIVAVGFDYLENIMTATVMHRYPLETFLLGDLAGWMTAMKWTTLSIAFGVSFLIGILVLKHKLRRSVHA